jgi:hypothetical protein
MYQMARNVPNGHKIYRIAAKRAKFYHFQAFKSIPKHAFLVREWVYHLATLFFFRRPFSLRFRTNFRNTDRKKARSRLPGADVAITVFCDFRQFSAEKSAFSLKTIVMMKKLEAYLAKNDNFFARN